MLNHLSSTYPSAVHVTAVNTTYIIECTLKAPTKLNFDISWTQILSQLIAPLNSPSPIYHVNIRNVRALVLCCIILFVFW